MTLFRLLCTLCLFLACVPVQAGETAYTVRSTELKAKPFIDAKTLATLPEKSQVEIMLRRGSWNQVRVDGKTGWMKMLSLRLGRSSGGRTGDSGFRTLFNVATTGRSGSMMTTGVRGLSEEKLRNPQPNPQALEELRGYAAEKDEARRFAAAGKLKAERVDYLTAPGK